MENVETADLSTDELVRLVLAGDVQVFRQIVVRYQGDVQKVASAILADHATVQDVVQEVFVRAFRGLGSYVPGKGFGRWIKGIARNVVREELRRKSRYRQRLATYAQLTEERLQDDDYPSPALSSALQDCIEALDEDAARAIHLHYVKRTRTDEIGRLIDRSGGAVRTLLHRARLALRACLTEKGVVT